MRLIIYDGIRYLLASYTDEAMKEFHAQLPAIKSDIQAMRATQFNDQKWFYRKGSWGIKEVFGTTTVTILSGSKPKGVKKPIQDKITYAIPTYVPAIDLFFADGTFAGLMVFESFDLQGNYIVIPSNALSAMPPFWYPQWRFFGADEPDFNNSFNTDPSFLTSFLSRVYENIPCIADLILDMGTATNGSIQDNTAWGETTVLEIPTLPVAQEIERWPCNIDRTENRGSVLFYIYGDGTEINYPPIEIGTFTEFGTVTMIVGAGGEPGVPRLGEITIPDITTPPEDPNATQFPSYKMAIHDDNFSLVPFPADHQFWPWSYEGTYRLWIIPPGYYSDVFTQMEAVFLNPNEGAFFTPEYSQTTKEEFTRLDGLIGGVVDLSTYASTWNAPGRYLGPEPWYFSVFGYTNIYDENGAPSVPLGETTEYEFNWEEYFWVSGNKYLILSKTTSPWTDDADGYYYTQAYPIRPRYWNIDDNIFAMLSLQRQMHTYTTGNCETEYYFVDYASNIMYSSVRFDYSHYLASDNPEEGYYYHTVPEVVINNQAVFGRGDYRLLRYSEYKSQELEIIDAMEE